MMDPRLLYIVWLHSSVFVFATITTAKKGKAQNSPEQLTFNVRYYNISNRFTAVTIQQVKCLFSLLLK